MDCDIVPCGRLLDDAALPDQSASWLDFGLELFQGRQVKNHSQVIIGHDGGGDLGVADVYHAVGCPAAHLRPVGREPRDLLALFHGRIGQESSHRKNSLTSKSGNFDFRIFIYFGRIFSLIFKLYFRIDIQ